MGASKGASSTGKAWVILIGGFFGVLLLEFAHGTSAGYAQNAGNRAFICDRDVQAKDRSDNRIDIPISTAVRLSATFPYISPASKPKKDSGVELGHVVDGGYADNEGILTAIEEINRLLFNKKASKQSRTEKIIFIRIDHGMTGTAEFNDSQTIANSSGIGYSILGPVLAAFNVRDTSQQERSEVELEILRKNMNQGGDPSNPKDPKIKFVEVSLRFQDNGSLKVPPLNWKLLPDQRILYTTAWKELIKDSYSPEEKRRKEHTGIRVLDELLKKDFLSDRGFSPWE